MENSPTLNNYPGKHIEGEKGSVLNPAVCKLSIATILISVVTVPMKGFTNALNIVTN